MNNKILNPKDFNSQEDIQKFIDDNNIESPREFKEKYGNIYNRACYLPFSLRLLYYHGYTGPKTEKQLKKFIKKNKIIDLEDFSIRFPEIFKKLKEFNLELNNFNFYKEMFIFPREILDKLENEEDFQKFIDDNNIVSSLDFSKRFSVVYKKLTTLKLQKGIKYHYIDKYDGPKTTEEIQEFINKNKIESCRDFSNRYQNIYRKIRLYFGFKSSNVIYYGKTKKSREITEEELNIKYLKDVQDYVIKHKIMSISELDKKSPTVYSKYKKLRKESPGKDVLFINSSLVESKQEELLIRELIFYGITEFQTKFYIEDSEYPTKRFDAYIPKFNMILEVHSIPHFLDELPKIWKNRDERENDKLKYKLALDNGYKIYYIAYGSNYDCYEKNGYFQKVYPNFKSLMEDLGIELHENKNFEEDFMRIYSDDFLNLASRICKEFEIYTLEDLMKFENFYNLISQFNLQDKIVLCNESAEQLKIKILKDKLLRKGDPTTVEEYQDFIIKNKIKSSKDFVKRFCTKYLNMVKLGISSKVNYCKEEKKPKSSLNKKDPPFVKKFNTLEDFQNYIDKHNFKNANEMINFNDDSRHLYEKIKRLGLNTKVVFKTNYSYWSLEVYQKYLIKNKISSKTEFAKFSKAAYIRAYRKGFLDKLTYYSEEQDLQEQQ